MRIQGWELFYPEKDYDRRQKKETKVEATTTETRAGSGFGAFCVGWRTTP